MVAPVSQTAVKHFFIGSGDQPSEHETDTYLVNIHLPNSVSIIGIRASENAIAGCDVLLGMDVIAGGDFAISNFNGQTWWTFRVPSNEPIDFVSEIRKHKQRFGPLQINSPEEKRNKKTKKNKEKKQRQKQKRKKR